MVGAVPWVVVLALGAGALGGPDALGLLIGVAGQNPVVDVGICFFVLSIVTAQLLGTVLLARFVRKAPGAGRGAQGRPGAQAADPFAHVTLLLSLAAAFLVTACLLVVPGGLGSACLLADFAAKYYPVVTVLLAMGATAALPRAIPLLRAFREPWNARGAAPAGRATATHHTDAARIVGLPLVIAVCALLVTLPFGALRLSPGFAVVVGATLLVRLYRRAARNVAVGGGGEAAPAPRTRGASASS